MEDDARAALEIADGLPQLRRLTLHGYPCDLPEMEWLLRSPLAGRLDYLELENFGGELDQLDRDDARCTPGSSRSWSSIIGAWRASGAAATAGSASSTSMLHASPTTSETGSMPHSRAFQREPFATPRSGDDVADGDRLWHVGFGVLVGLIEVRVHIERRAVRARRDHETFLARADSPRRT